MKWTNMVVWTTIILALAFIIANIITCTMYLGG